MTKQDETDYLPFFYKELQDIKAELKKQLEVPPLQQDKMLIAMLRARALLFKVKLNALY